MKNLLFFSLFLLFTSTINAQNLYKATSGSITFFSETPMENIDATNKNLKALINTDNGEVAFVVTNVGFKFEKPLMEEHFNENYMESDKYKLSVFKGKIVGDNLNYSKNGTYKVKAIGTLDIHGVEQKREIEGEITIKDGMITLNSRFNVALKDHKIKIPKVVIKNIAEVVEVTVNINLEKKQ